MLNKELILKKIEQIGTLISELKELLKDDVADFIRNIKIVRSAERNFQLMVDTAIDINGKIILERSKKIPDSYRQSFLELETLEIFSHELASSLAPTASLRNILVHEYDFEEDYNKFYEAAKASIPVYEEYCKAIHRFIEKNI